MNTDRFALVRGGSDCRIEIVMHGLSFAQAVEMLNESEGDDVHVALDHECLGHEDLSAVAEALEGLIARRRCAIEAHRAPRQTRP